VTLICQKQNNLENNNKSSKNVTIPEKLKSDPEIGHISFHLSSAPGLV
jgi:hypothetical protein